MLFLPITHSHAPHSPFTQLTLSISHTNRNHGDNESSWYVSHTGFPIYLPHQTPPNINADIKNGTGRATSLFLNSSIPKPTPSPGQALVKIKAFGLNRMDLLQREGHYPVPPQAPKTLGVEFSGTIEDVPNTNCGFKKGDEVFGLAYGGAYAEYIVVNTKMLLHKPHHLSWEQAAGVPEVLPPFPPLPKSTY